MHRICIHQTTTILPKDVFSECSLLCPHQMVALSVQFHETVLGNVGNDHTIIRVALALRSSTWSLKSVVTSMSDSTSYSCCSNTSIFVQPEI